MRRRVLRRMEKRVRTLPRHQWNDFRWRGKERVDVFLMRLMLDASQLHITRREAARILGVTGDARPCQALLDLFLKQTDANEIYVTALAIEETSDPGFALPLIRILLADDSSADHRRGAARALGWMNLRGRLSRRAARALCQVLSDTTQAGAVREEAAESLKYLDWTGARDKLIAAMEDPNRWVRFFAVFALGGIYQSRKEDPTVIAALERRLDDHEFSEDSGYWPVSKEALAMLAQWRKEYWIQAVELGRQTTANPNSPKCDREWAQFYGYDREKRFYRSFR
jgi:HEAT repeat protein